MKDIIYILSKTDSDIKETISLVKKEYIRQGYIDQNNTHKIETPKASVVFMAKHANKIVGTISLFLDSDLGLPMDEIYSKELNKLRFQNKKIVEVGRLAIDSDFLSEKLGLKRKYNNLLLVSSLFKLVFHYCIYKKFDNICISINPKHSLFYKSIFFKNIGDLRFYPLVNNAPALAKTLDINKVKNKKIKSYLLNKLFLNNPPDYKMFDD